MLANLFKTLAPGRSATVADPTEAIRRNLEAGAYAEALRTLDVLPPGHIAEADVDYLRGVCLAGLGKEREALASLRRAAALAPDRAAFQLTAARACLTLALPEEATRYCHRALAADPDCSPAHTLLAAIDLPGEDYFALLRRIHAHVRPRTYVEIGIWQGASLRLADATTSVIGIDPEPRLDAPPASNQRVFRQTSDAFFAEHDLGVLFGGVAVDLAFIDGMHRFEFVLRDFVNLERFCTRESTIVVHDCFPLDAATAARERVTRFWSGDVWRAVLALKQYRPDLAIHTVAAPPTGLAVIRNLDPSSRVLAGRLDRVCAEFLAVDFAAIAGTKAESLNLFPNDWEKVKTLFGASDRRPAD
jgi:tetratricopeptide (TPR) repeat protein